MTRMRLRIVGELAAVNEAMSYGDISVVKEIAKSTGSYQFKMLREAGLIRMTPQGQRQKGASQSLGQSRPPQVDRQQSHPNRVE